MVGGAGLKPARNPERAIHASHQTQPDATSHLANTAAIVRGLREGTASARRKIADHVVAAGTMSNVFEGVSSERGRGMRPSNDYGRIQQFAEAPLIRAAAEGLEVQSYRGATPVENDHRVAHGYASDQTLFSKSDEVTANRKTQAPRFVSHTKDDSELGLDDESTFGIDTVAEGGMTGGAPGTKLVRSHDLGDEGMLETDSLAEIEH
jgi:hypothetical protein